MCVVRLCVVQFSGTDKMLDVEGFWPTGSNSNRKVRMTLIGAVEFLKCSLTLL